LHKASTNCGCWCSQQGRHDAASAAGVKSKIPRFPLRKCTSFGAYSRLFPAQIVAAAAWAALALPQFLPAQEETAGSPDHEREELGVNRYTAPRIEQVFERLDRLKPLPFTQLWRDLPANTPARREQKGLIFGGLIADGFLVVAAQKQNLVEDLGRVLLREARGLGVGDRVMRHSASLTELGRAGNWTAVRKELIETQADVEHAMISLRDEKMAALISLGGWLRGLEISASAVEGKFTPERAEVLNQPELVDYFAEELTTLPPVVAHHPIFEKLRSGVKQIQTVMSEAGKSGLQLPQVRAIRDQAQELDLAVRRNN
jgi:hypothetical protein